MTREEWQAELEAIVAELLPRTSIPAGTVHAEVRADPTPDAFSYIHREPGWDTLLAEARPGQEWDSPEARLVLTTGLVEKLTLRQIRAVAGHELAHIEAGDHLHDEWEDATRRRMERQADARGMAITGDGPALAVALLRIFKEICPESREHQRSHGRVDVRVTAIGREMSRGFDLG
jgi:Zn-dependent protease with chaperone function